MFSEFTKCFCSPFVINAYIYDYIFMTIGYLLMGLVKRNNVVDDKNKIK